MQTSGRTGMITFETALRNLVQEGKVAKDAMDNFLGHNLTGQGDRQENRQLRENQMAGGLQGNRINHRGGGPQGQRGGTGQQRVGKNFGFKKRSS